MFKKVRTLIKVFYGVSLENPTRKEHYQNCHTFIRYITYKDTSNILFSDILHTKTLQTYCNKNSVGI